LRGFTRKGKPLLAGNEVNLRGANLKGRRTFFSNNFRKRGQHRVLPSTLFFKDPYLEG